MKNILTLILAGVLCTAAFADTIKVRFPSEPVNLITALVALDGQDRVVTSDGQDKVVRVPYDLGKDAVRIRLAIRKNLLALRTAVEEFEKARTGYVREVFGVDSMDPSEFAKQPAEKQAQFNAKAAQLLTPVEIEISPFTEADITTFAAAGVPGSVSVALETMVAKPKPTVAKN